VQGGVVTFAKTKWEIWGELEGELEGVEERVEERVRNLTDRQVELERLIEMVERLL
jgi:hypothetical protein